MTDLRFPDTQGYADLATLVRRARQADPEAAVRLQAVDRVLRVWIGVLPGHGLFADGAAIGVRGIELAAPAHPEGSLDIVCASGALADRFARDGAAATTLAVPPASVYAAWSGSLPGVGGWTSAGTVTPGRLLVAARDGIAEIAEGVGGRSAGAVAVEELRRRVWGRAVDGEVPAGAAFAAYVLGFVREDDPPVAVFRAGRWVRLGTRLGHVVARP